MRWLLFLLLIPVVQGIGIAASPPTINLEHGEGNFFLVNPNDKSVLFDIYSDLSVSPRQGTLSSFEHKQIFVEGHQDSNLTITFASQEDMHVRPALFLPIIYRHTEKFSYLWAGLVMVFGCLFLVLLFTAWRTLLRL